jgi:hypothetical protein
MISIVPSPWMADAFRNFLLRVWSGQDDRLHLQARMA